MTTIKTIFIAALLGMGISSCNFLDKTPTYLTPETFFNNEEEALSFLTGVYSPINQTPFYGSDYLWLVGNDDLSHYGGPGRSPMTTGLACNNANSSDPTVASLWRVLYSGIDRANMLLERLDNTPNISTASKEQIRSEARFLRAFYYFNLIQCWGDVPFKTVSTQSVNNLNRPRTNKQEIYDFVCREMEECISGLKTAKDLNFNAGRVTQSAAWGLLARVNLFRAGEHFRDKKAPDAAHVKKCFEEASRCAQKVMAEGHDLTDDYWQTFIDLAQDKYNTTDKKESIWEAEMGGNRASDVRGEGKIGGSIGLQGPDLSSTNFTGKENPGFSYAFMYSTPKLLEMYEKEGDTERCDWNIAPFKYTTGTNKAVNGRLFEYGKLGTLKYPCYEYGSGDTEKKQVDSDKDKARMAAKYRREYEILLPKSKNDTPINFPILRYSDVLLMIAEAENEINNGPNALAYSCLNKVRSRVGLSEVEGQDRLGFRQAIKNERAMELCFEYTRHFDLIRWGEFVSLMNEQSSLAKAGINWPAGKTYVYSYFSISDAYNYFPIPDSEMAINKEIKENNPGW